MLVHWTLNPNYSSIGIHSQRHVPAGVCSPAGLGPDDVEIWTATQLAHSAALGHGAEALGSDWTAAGPQRVRGAVLIEYISRSKAVHAAADIFKACCTYTACSKPSWGDGKGTSHWAGPVPLRHLSMSSTAQTCVHQSLCPVSAGALSAGR